MMKKLSISISCISWFLSMCITAHSQRPFITIWKTDNRGISQKNEIVLPIEANSFKLTWEDLKDSLNRESLELKGKNNKISFPYPSTYKLSIIVAKGETLSFRSIQNYNSFWDGEKLLNIVQWGDIEWVDFTDSFANCYYLDISATDIPNLSSVKSLKNMFAECKYLIGNSSIGNWNTATITDMSGMFSGTYKFNQPIGNWNTRNVTNMSKMFDGALEFNQSIENWNTSKVTNMSGMFSRTLKFNQPINRWNTRNVINMNGMFYFSTSFNQPVNRWNVRNVKNMNLMFFHSDVFNQPLNKWNTKNVTDMGSMFEGAKMFNQKIGKWNVENVTNIAFMFKDATAFNQPVGKWKVKNVKKSNGMFENAKSFSQDLSKWNLDEFSLHFMFHPEYEKIEPR